MSMRFLLILALTAILAGCGPTIDYRVKVSHNITPESDISRFETYQWVPLSETIKGGDFDTNFLASMKIAFMDAFKAKGYRRVEQSSDFLVALYVIRGGKIISSDWGWNYQWDQRQWDDYWMERRVSTKEVGEGTIVLDILDNRKKELAWSGTANAVIIPGASGEKRNERIDEAVEKLLAKFPTR